MTHNKRPFETENADIDDAYDVRKTFSDRSEGSRDRRWNYDDDEGSSKDETTSVDGSDRKNYWNRKEDSKEREDWNSDRRELWSERKSHWGDKNDEKKRDWNSKDNWNRNKGSWNERKDVWNKRRDDPWDERDNRDRRNRDNVDEGRDDRRGRRDRDRSRDRDRRDRDRSRERSRSYRRSHSKSPDRDNQSSQAGEWICKCGALNFKRRITCFRSRCGASRSEAVSVVSPNDKSAHNKNTNYALMISTQQYTAEDIPALASYSAEMYAGNKTEQNAYLKYYTDYYTQLLSQKSSGESRTETDKVNAAAAVAHSAISQVQAKATPIKTPPTGTDNKIYPIPDISTYLYDQTSGYYYDQLTGLYYDASTQYYFNNQINQYLYWDSIKHTYVLASTLQLQSAVVTANASVANSASELPDANDNKDKSVEKVDKVKVAKKIAKDMERWAKAMNQKKEASKVLEPQANANASSSKSADIGFSVLEQRVPAVNSAPVVNQTTSLVSTYGNGSDCSDDESNDINLIDWEKLACLLCKRQFPSREVLEKHQLMSELHKQNLEMYRGNKEPKLDREMKSNYRDRAAERRMKYGDDEVPIVRATRPDPVVPSVPREIGEENIGNRLLKKMGWTAGTGLGKEGQGILGPVEATTTGLGRKKGIYTAGPGETYRGCVKKLTMARYQDLIGSEGNS